MNASIIAPSAPNEPRQRRILCVDDEPNILSSLRRMFMASGHQVTTADSAAMGLEILALESFDAIICDMRMPNMDGAAFFEQVRRQWPLPVRLLLTGHADTTSAIAAINQGEIYRYITKPWVDDELIAILNSAFELLQLKQEREELLQLALQQNNELEEKVQIRTADLNQANEKLKVSYISSIKAFSNLLDLRKSNLLAHSRKVAYLSMEISKLAGFDDKRSQEVFIAGLLHDIGKIGMSDRVLSTSIAELPLSDLELYKNHPSMGASCLVSLDDMTEVSAMIRAHHERFDGKGFPDGLRGEEIPMGGRILAIVEAYEELKNADISKVHQSKEQAQKIIAGLVGKYFCPQATDLFFKALKTFSAKA